MNDAYWEYLRKTKEDFEEVILVPGNHEYLRRDMTETDALLERRCNEIGVILLQKGVLYLEGVRIIGCTLWCNATEEAYALHVSKKGKKWIPNMTHDSFISLHNDHVRFISEELERDFETPTIVCTHYGPLIGMMDPEKEDAKSSMFVTDLSYQFCKPVIAWLCGHTHFNTIIHYNSIPCISNCFGYPGEKTGYSPSRMITVSKFRVSVTPRYLEWKDDRAPHWQLPNFVREPSAKVF